MVDFGEVAFSVESVVAFAAHLESTKIAEVCCSVLQCVAVCCSVLQCVAVCCSVLSTLRVDQDC